MEGGGVKDEPCLMKGCFHKGYEVKHVHKIHEIYLICFKMHFLRPYIYVDCFVNYTHFPPLYLLACES